jgi:hypothetical protein
MAPRTRTFGSGTRASTQLHGAGRRGWSGDRRAVSSPLASPIPSGWSELETAFSASARLGVRNRGSDGCLQRAVGLLDLNLSRDDRRGIGYGESGEHRSVDACRPLVLLRAESRPGGERGRTVVRQIQAVGGSRDQVIGRRE